MSDPTGGERRTSGVSIKDVARHAGVSVGTVSNVLNRPSAVRASTRARVEAAIDELAFVPSASARQLVGGESRTLAYVVLDASNPFFTDVARGVDEVAAARGLSLFLCDSDRDQGRENRHLDRLTELRVRGVLITAIDDHNPRLAQLRQLGIPVVLVDRVPGEDADWCSVGVDDVAGGRMAAGHLLDLGHRSLCFVGGPQDLPQVAQRRAGALEAAVAAGLEEGAVRNLDTGALTIAEGRKAAERILGLADRQRPTAVFCANDLVAFGLAQCLLQHGVDVPAQIAVVGYDDIELAAAASVPLTSVAQPRALLGRAAAELLLDGCATPGHRHRQELFLPELAARASSLQTR
jgi:LacI family transcriptional regulator